MTKPPSTTTAELRQDMLNALDLHLDTLAEYQHAREVWLAGDRGQLGPDAEAAASATERERQTRKARDAAMDAYTERRLAEARDQLSTGP